MAQDFSATCLRYKNNIPANIAPVYLTGFLDIYHQFSSGLPVIRAFVFMRGG
jgi:hypothetical protein